MSQMTEEEIQKFKDNPSVMVEVKGKPFYCSCGCNVFHHPDTTMEIYECNGCGERYKGVGIKR